MVTEGPDFPPVTPLLARLSELIFGGSLAGFRVLPALAGAAIVVLAGLLARELGGGRAAQVLAGLAVLGSPMFLGANALLQTVTFDQLAWVVVLFLLTRLLRTDDPRWWPAVGAAVGVGLQTKFTTFTLALGIAVGLLPPRSDAICARRGRGWRPGSPWSCWHRTWSGRRSTAGQPWSSSTTRPLRSPARSRR